MEIRVTSAFGFSHYGNADADVRTSSVFALSQFKDRTIPAKVSSIFVMVHMSTDGGIHPALTAADSSEVFKPTVTRKPVKARIPLKEREINPFPATSPASLQGVSAPLAGYLDEQGRHIREQHNNAQAGDSTFPWEQLTKLGKVPLYTLGSLGRFFHDSYGIVMARYVQYSKMRPGTWINGPAGRLRTSQTVDWIVSNDYDLSGAAYAMGIIGAYKIPGEGDYGWLIVCGANITALPYAGVLAPPANAEIIWSGFERVDIAGEGVVLGTVWKPSKLADLGAGAAFLNVGARSIDSYKATLKAQFEAIAALDADYETRLALLEGTLTGEGLPAQFTALQKQVTANHNDIITEAQKRAADIVNLQAVNWAGSPSPVSVPSRRAKRVS